MFELTEKNTYVICRTFSAGVHIGILQDASDDRTVVRLQNTRRVHYWSGAASLSQMARDGVSKPTDCRFSVEIPTIVLTGVIEIMACSQEAETNLKAVPEWKA